MTGEGSTETQTKARNIVQRQLLKSAPRFAGSTLGKTGLVGAAAGVWTVVGLELYYLPCWECDGRSIQVASQQKVADGAFVARWREYLGSSYGQTDGVSFVTYASAKRDSSNLLKTELYTTNKVLRWGYYFNGVEHSWRANVGSVGMYSSANDPTDVSKTGANLSSAPNYERYRSRPGSATFAGQVMLEATTGNNGSYSFQRKQMCAYQGPCVGGVSFPTVESGTMTQGSLGGDASPFKTTASEGNQFISSVVADPETETLPIPDYPPNWDDLPDPPADPYENPDADPDKDGTPNRTDDDPEGDGDPDGDGNPNEHPRVTPYPENPDTDGDGVPDTTDPDDDNDGLPDTEDPNPYVADPPPDADKDGDPDSTDPDDDNDGIPETDDPEPKTPTNPATLPKDHPYADPDEDGTPNKDDPDNDGDGTPDTEDPEPNNPEVGAPDLDKDGIPDKSDGDQDGDGVPDWEDIERRTQAVPNQTPDGDDDGVPDWSDPWPGNPYAPADPTKDGDSDDVPDYKDPEPAQPNVPMSPWPSGSPGDVPSNPGEPNMTANPTNPNHPPSSSTPAQPTDPSSPLDPNAPINPSAPENPGEPGGPPGEGDGCPVARESAFKLPTIEVASVFPFNLVIWCYGAVASLHKPPSAPEWEVPFLGTMNLSTQEGLFGAVRTVLTSLILIALVMGWYSYIKGSEA